MSAEVLRQAATFVERMAADHEGAAVHLLASPNRIPIALDEARVREGVAANLRYLAGWLRDVSASEVSSQGGAS